MRKQFVKTIEEILKKDTKLVLLLGDIGVFGFRNSFKEFPDRIYNIGILEQSTVGMAAGLSMTNFIPVVHTIAPFIVERALEQIKNDFGYQKLGGNFVSVGASYDYTALGGTHHCPGDVGILKNVPGVQIVLPGTAHEFDLLFKNSYNNKFPTYFRLSEQSNLENQKVKFGKANIIKSGKKATIIAVGPMLDRVVLACKDMDVTILYYTTVAPFDKKTLSKNVRGGKIIVCEPYYSGALTEEITEVSGNAEIFHIGVPKKFIHSYGNVEELDSALGVSVKSIRNKIKKII